MELITTDKYNIANENIISKNNLTLCQADYFETCWCKFNSTKPLICHYLLNYVESLSNSSYFCIYHLIKNKIECFNSSYILPENSFSNFYIYLNFLLFIIGFIGNGISIIILLSTKLRYLNVYKNLTILCFLNILYLMSILIRYENNYKKDLRNISFDYCRLHTFIVAFLGHLCSWQLVLTCIQRVYALLSLQAHRTTSWARTWIIFFFGIVIPFFIFDSQILFNYGIFQNKHICNEIINNDEIKQFQRALKYPINILNSIRIEYYLNWIPSKILTNTKKDICILWNIFDTFIYAIIPFIIILICSFIIIIKVCQRHRSTIILGGIISQRNQDIFISPRDQLSTLLITTNILFFLMIGPLNICLIIQSIFECFFFKSSIKIFFYLNEYLRLLQNSYHALSFVFYCLIGKKFRNSAKIICRIIYYKFIQFTTTNPCTQTSVGSCCLDRRRSSSSGQTISTNSRLSDNKRLTIEQKSNNSIPLNIIQRPTYVTFNIQQKTIIQSTIIFSKDEYV